MPKRRVTFSFDGATEVSYVRVLPVVGDRVSHRGEIWTVMRVEDDELGPRVTCELPPQVHERTEETATSALH
jgi:hypothetical protein